MYTINAKTFADAIRQHSKIVDRLTTVPVLAGVLIQARGDQLAITSTDLDMELTTLHTGETPAGAAFKALPKAETLKKALTGAKRSQTVALAPIENGLRLTIEGVEYDLPDAAPASEFPQMPMDGAKEWRAPAGLADALEFVSTAMSTEETRYYLNGACLYYGPGGECGVVATDGHRLLAQELDAARSGAPPAASNVAHEYQAIIPRKAVPILAGMLADHGDRGAPLYLRDDRIKIGVPGALFTIKLVDGCFPDWRRVVPIEDDESFGFTVEHESLADPLERMAKFSPERARPAKVTVNGSVRVEMSNPEAGSARAEIRADHHGEGEIAFNARYLVDALAPEKDGLTRLHCAADHAPARVTYPDRPDRMGVIMPLAR